MVKRKVDGRKVLSRVHLARGCPWSVHIMRITIERENTIREVSSILSREIKYKEKYKK